MESFLGFSFCSLGPDFLLDFCDLYLRVVEVVVATCFFTFGLLILDLFISLGSLATKVGLGADLDSKLIPNRAEIGIRILKCLRTSLLISLILLVPLTCGALRRTFTDASSFDISQMWWHSLCSVVDIVLTLLINKFIARNTLQQMGYPSYPANGLSAFIPNIRRWVSRIIVVHIIVVGTHLVTPFLYAISGCMENWYFVNYQHNAFYLEYGIIGLTYFMLVQQICFAINGIDEESSWRGFANAVWMKEDHSPYTLYLVSGWIYAMVHSLNTPYKDFLGFLIVLLNLICEGASWMLLYRTSHDLVQNWFLHDVDDLFSIWIGARSLAGYGLPAGQVAPYTIGCRDMKYVSGGDFGTGGSILYFFQTGYTAIFILCYSIIIWAYDINLPVWNGRKDGRKTFMGVWRYIKLLKGGDQGQSLKTTLKPSEPIDYEDDDEEDILYVT